MPYSLSYRHLGLLFFAGLFSFLYYDLIIDDSFLLYRYGKNLVENSIWNYNPENLHLNEAYTSFLGAALSVFPEFFGLNPKWFFVLVQLVVLFFIVQRVRKEQNLNLELCSWLILSNALFYVHFFSGMETFLFMLLLFGLSWVIVRKTNSRWIPFLSLLLFLTRPDAIFFSLYGFYVSSRSDQKNLLYALFGIVSIAAYWLIRYQFFGEFYPNPVLIKSLQGFKPIIFLANLFDAKVYLLLLAASIWFAKDSRIKQLGVLAIATLVLLYAPSRLMMNYGDRFFFQISFPILCLALLVSKPSLRIAWVLIVVFNLNSLAPFKYNPLITYGQRLKNSYIHLGKSLSNFEGNTMITGEAGSIPYYSGWINQDPLGLGTRKKTADPIEFLEDSQADLVLLYETENGKFELIPGSGKSEEIENWLVENQYSQVGYCWFSPNYRIASFLKKGIENELEIKNALKENESYSKSSVTDFQAWFYGYFQ